MTSFCWSNWKNYQGGKKPHAKTVAWSYDLEGHARICVERCCELANKKVQQLYKVSSPCLDDSASQSLLTNCLDMLVPGTNWKTRHSVAQACDRRLARLISYIHHTNEFRQYCYVGNTAQHCRLGLFQDSDFAGDLEDSKSTSGRVFSIFGSPTFVSISWMCKKQASVSHSSTESEIISLDAGLRMDGSPALDLWDMVIDALRSTNNTARQGGLAQGDLCGTGEWNHLLRLFNIMSFSMISCSHFSNFLSDLIGKQSAMSKRSQEATSSEGSPMAKPKPMLPSKARPVNLV